MQVVVLPNQRRSGIGRLPTRENRRAWLPEQARFCPVLEDASRSGFLVYPPLHPHESYEVRLTRTNSFEITFYVAAPGGVRASAFAVEIQPSAGTGGLDQTEIVFLEERGGLSPALVQEMVDALVTNVNGPPGGIGLRGAHDFVTASGWDTLYFGLLNEPQQPAIPVLTARVETDWYAQATEFRYILQRGDAISVAGDAPIGQVLFVPREPVELRVGGDGDRARFLEAQREYWAARHGKERMTNFGTTYSHHYRDEQRAHRRPGEPPLEDGPPIDGAPAG
ncbi:MAG: hypothetical protein U0360_00280 [Dehalococcoidia bacterium]